MEAARIAHAPFVGRADDLRLLREGWADALGGEAVTWLVGGDAGVGKTRLVQALVAQLAGEGATALVGACLDLGDGGLPLWPVVQGLRERAAALPADEREALFGGADSELARILPELRGDAATPATAASAQGQLFELVLGVLERLAARGPVLVVVEDLHWADRSTRDLLAFLTRTLGRRRIMVVATYRSDELFRGHPLRAFLAELYRARSVRRLELRPFTRDELGEHLTAILGAPAPAEVVEPVFERSEGNAFYAEELVAAWREAHGGELPSTLRDILLTRVEHRSPTLQEVLRVAAVGGRRVRADLLEAVCDVPGADRHDALREAVTHHLLVPDGPDAYAFRHALLREAVYQELLPGERSRLHARFGVTLSERPELASDPAALAGELAHHWLAAHDLPRALPAAVAAGDAAAALWGFAEAGAHFERALELWDQVPDAEDRTGLDHVTLSRRAAEAANLAGDHARAGGLVRAAIARAEPGRAGLLWERLGRYLWASGDSDAALGAYEQALRLVAEDAPSAARARVLAAHGQSLMLLGRFDASRDRCEEAIAIARAVGARAEEGHALNTLGCSLAFLGEPGDAVGHLRRARDIAEEVGDLDDLGRAYQNLSEILGGPLNRLEECLDVALQGHRRIERLGMARDYGVSLEVNAATALLGLGRWDEAEALLSVAEDRRPMDMAAIELHLCRARLDVGRGAFDGAAAHLEAARRMLSKTLDPQFRSMLCARHAELLLWQRRPQEARAAVASGRSGLEQGDDWFLGPVLWLGAWADVDAGIAPDEHVGRAGELLRTAQSGRRFVSPVAVAYARLCDAEGSRPAGGDAERWQSAAATWARLGHPYPEAYARWRAAEALLGRRRGTPGAAALRSAHRIARRLGAGPLTEEIELLAQRARVDLAEAAAEPAAPPQEDATRRLGLTPRERQVLELVAGGLTNREIARELFVTEKTAGAHVSSILAKLGVRGRVEAATVAHRLGIAPRPRG